MAKKRKQQKKKTEKTKKRNKNKKRIPVVLYVAAGLVVFCLVIMGLFLFFYKEPTSMYVFPENPKQGDTVFIRIKGVSDNITGSFGKSFGAGHSAETLSRSPQDEQKLIFYKKGNSSEWISFLGIDAGQKPGDYNISVDTSGTEKLIKEIKVALADFSVAPAAKVPNLAEKGYTNQKAVDNIVKNDSPVLKKVLSNFTPEPYFKDSFSFPLSVMERSGYSFGKFISFAEYKLQHLGVDLRAPEKTDIYSINDGKVVAAVNLSNGGKTVIIDHGLDIFSLYLHLDEFKVSEGDMVKQGQIIGLSGDTGYSTAPHLHFSIRVGTSRVDPVVFIETTKKLDDNYSLADITSAFLNIINQN